MKILVIEDEQSLQEAIKSSLEKENYVVETASDFNTALEKVFVYEYDCILLDIMLPYGSGLDILKELKERTVLTTAWTTTGCSFCKKHKKTRLF